MMKGAVQLVFALAAGVALQSELLACELSISAPGSVQFEGPDGQGYDSFASQQYETDFLVTVENSGLEACKGQLSFRAVASQVRLLDVSGASLFYEVLGPTSTNAVITAAGSPIDLTAAVPVDLPANQSRQLAFRFRIPPRQIVPAGNYNQSVAIEFVPSGEEFAPIERPLEMLSRVRSSMSLMLVSDSLAQTSSDGRSATMDFGVLEEGEQMSLSLLVLSNNAYRVEFLSENAGRLVHTVLGSSQSVPYELLFAGSRIPLDAISAGTSPRDPTPPGGDRSAIVVRIGEVGLARAGTYEDVITVSVRPD